MKKLVTIIASVIGAVSLSYGQGTVSLNNSASAYFVTTNGSSLGLGTGNAGTGAKSYYYTLLVSSYDGSAPAPITAMGGASQLSSTVNGSAWTQAGIMGTNNSLTKGAIQAPSGQVMGAGIWDGPTAADYTTGTIRYYEIVGWSANLGSDWATIANSIATGNWAVTGAGSWFGASAIGYNYSGGGLGGQPTVSLFTTAAATGLAGSGLISPLVLTPIVPTPEPTTLALGALGSAAMLLIRRRK